MDMPLSKEEDMRDVMGFFVVFVSERLLEMGQSFGETLIIALLVWMMGNTLLSEWRNRMSVEQKKQFYKIAIVIVVFLAASSVARLLFNNLLLRFAPEIAAQRAATYSVYLGGILGVYLGYLLFGKREND